MTRFIESTITFPYKRSLGPVVGAFMTALTEKQILAIATQKMPDMNASSIEAAAKTIRGTARSMGIEVVA